MGAILAVLALLSLLGLGSANLNPLDHDLCLDFDPENCTLTFAPDTSRLCGVLIKCGWDCRSVEITHNNKTWNNTLSTTWEPGVPEWYTVSVRGPDGSIRISNNTFIFSEMCDLAMFMSRQYDLWPPSKENIVAFSIAYCLVTCIITAIICVCIHLLIVIRPRQSNKEKEKMP
ncbi:19 kDa MHC class I antigen-binding glycoprotein [Human adenovirus 7]|uniref:Early E3 18.5 kDa glycoprotein n=1 Tax=Human adenovirus B serotype 7 TaxID=10519 RepID=A0A8B0L9D6_ADE07|nr:19 kDa MHC class I antigen-binding glycoprotein [Human adenovirus 7]QTV99725.1 19 kDa MHC class I antigen-binding glycoprotein [Human adenovirus 7]